MTTARPPVMLGDDDKVRGMTGTEFGEFIEKMREAMAPVFEEQRQTWEREGPAATAAFNATGATLRSLGGNCPVQGYGDVDGKAFYFRARGDGWQFHVAASDAAIFHADIFYLEGDYGEGFDAGWMPKHEALRLIVSAIAAFRVAPSPSTPTPESSDD